MKLRLTSLVLAAAVSLTTPAALFAQAAPAGGGGDAPQIFLEKPPKIVAYQLKRLSNEQLLKIERNTGDPKYRPVYETIVTRKGLEKKQRQEALDALVTLNKSDSVTELLPLIGGVEKDDNATVQELAGMLLAQKPETLKAQRPKIQEMAAGGQDPRARQVALAAMAVADGKPDEAWALAGKGTETLPLVLGSIALIPDPAVRGAFYPSVQPLVTQAPDEATQVAAIEAVSYIPGHEDEVFKLLADMIQKAEGAKRAAAVRSIRRVPAAKWPADQVAPLAQAIVKLVEQTPAEQRTEPAGVETIQFGNELAAAMPADEAAPVRKALRELGVQVVMMRTVKEQMLYDLRYFVVEAGKPVQITLDNVDTMPHNIVVTEPGAMQEIGVTGGSLPQPNDPAVKPYVPEDHEKLLEASFPAHPGESITLSFDAPADPGEYPYVCTFPGHWVRMYGVMKVVEDIEAYDQDPEVPTDPLTRQPFKSQKHEATDATAQAAHEHQHP